MILDTQHAAVLREYARPLQKLEKAFNKAKLPVALHVFVTPHGNKMVEITYKNQKQRKLLCIEGDNPAQAVKDVAEEVRL